MALTEDNIRLIGDDLIRVTGLPKPELRTLGRELRASREWLEVVDGIEDSVVQFDPLSLRPDEAVRHLLSSKLLAEIRSDAELPEVCLQVEFGEENGPDFRAVCDELKLTEQELISAICEAELRVDIVGFTPGFAYISGLPEALTVPRLKDPRKRVPAGSFGIAAGKCGTYALEGPGGWPLIGRVVNRLFNPESEQPFLLSAGQKVRVVSRSDA
ncbi:carboxyltransferase domain-containing protein [Ponticaulis sp.]|uniref:5-oxoprolinase subunit B family protein n=1 Tax=Ponticaulis sp. TaxID=2020902 RepID=UPI002607D223|nr:carboxyltransferase domain-containing protein [Ponticaulis sp.]MDF1681589.1 carboxyltransferase domain-containing protein [Ponticaulis sp.]